MKGAPINSSQTPLLVGRGYPQMKPYGPKSSGAQLESQLSHPKVFSD